MGVESDLTFLPMGLDVLDRVLRDDLRGASDAVGAELPEFFRAEKWLWQVRSDQIRQSPGSAPWLVRAVVDPESGAVVGHAGFHGPPDAAGAVEVGYTVVPDSARPGPRASHPRVTGRRGGGGSGRRAGPSLGPAGQPAVARGGAQGRDAARGGAVGRGRRPGAGLRARRRRPGPVMTGTGVSGGDRLPEAAGPVPCGDAGEQEQNGPGRSPS